MQKEKRVNNKLSNIQIDNKNSRNPLIARGYGFLFVVMTTV
jgi:hypothetical protein